MEVKTISRFDSDRQARQWGHSEDYLTMILINDNGIDKSIEFEHGDNHREFLTMLKWGAERLLKKTVQ